MTTERQVDVESLCERPLALFESPHNAWEHLIKHVLDNHGEFEHWGLLIPALRRELDAGKREELYELARNGSPDAPAERLEAIFTAFLDLLQKAVERGVRMEWYWEMRPGQDERWKVFSLRGVFALLDEDRVRTGFLPCTDELPSAGLTEQERRHTLFEECRKIVRRKYQADVKEDVIERISSTFESLLHKGLEQAIWEALI